MNKHQARMLEVFDEAINVSNQLGSEESLAKYTSWSDEVITGKPSASLAGWLQGQYEYYAPKDKEYAAYLLELMEKS
jgi:hypothetical protein